jgi:hypothetical protein
MSAAQPLPASNNSSQGRILRESAETSGGVSTSTRTAVASTDFSWIVEGRRDTKSLNYIIELQNGTDGWSPPRLSHKIRT